MITIVEGGTPRSKLNEGRGRGFGSTFLKKIGVNKYVTLFGLTTCKDYLHDVLAAEHLDVKVDVFGLKYTKQEPFKTAYAYMAISMLPQKWGAWEELEAEKEVLKKNIESITALINACEYPLKCPQYTKIYPTADENVWLVKVPKFWVKTTYLISLYTFLLRIGYKERMEQLNLDEYVKVLMEMPYQSGDFGNDLAMFKDIWPKFEWLKKNGCPSEDFKKREEHVGTSHGWHNNGIKGVSFEPKSKWLE